MSMVFSFLKNMRMSAATKVSCLQCSPLKSTVRKHLEAFKIIAKLTPNLSSDILLNNLEAILEKWTPNCINFISAAGRAPEKKLTQSFVDQNLNLAATSRSKSIAASPAPARASDQSRSNQANSATVLNLKLANELIGRETLRSGRVMYKCLICKKLLTKPYIARAHLGRIHFKQDQLHCSHCPKIFYEKKLLDLHRSECSTKIFGVEKGKKRSKHVFGSNNTASAQSFVKTSRVGEGDLGRTVDPKKWKIIAPRVSERHDEKMSNFRPQSQEKEMRRNKNSEGFNFNVVSHLIHDDPRSNSSSVSFGNSEQQHRGQDGGETVIKVDPFDMIHDEGIIKREPDA